jgi:hypothetical protein
MEWLNSLGAVVLGLLVRFGIPIGATALIAWLLRVLDLRWQREAEARRSVPAVGAAARSVRCWEELGCPEERRQGCPAFARPDVPCWQAFRDAQGSLRPACLECVVFREAPVPLTA